MQSTNEAAAQAAQFQNKRELPSNSSTYSLTKSDADLSDSDSSSRDTVVESADSSDMMDLVLVVPVASPTDNTDSANTAPRPLSTAGNGPKPGSSFSAFGRNWHFSMPTIEPNYAAKCGVPNGPTPCLHLDPATPRPGSWKPTQFIPEGDKWSLALPFVMINYKPKREKPNRPSSCVPMAPCTKPAEPKVLFSYQMPSRVIDVNSPLQLPSNTMTTKKPAKVIFSVPLMVSRSEWTESNSIH